MEALIKRILICDDVADDALLLQAILLADDCQIQIVSSGKEVLSFLKTNSNLPDLLILDVMMPVMDGFEVVQRIRESNKLKSLPVLLVTGMNIDDTNLDIKVDGFIQKPINIDTVISQVRAILD
ncbi:response regulator [Nostoc sp. 106C]|uniref:response regulator n=1 Tax=Nostoc sp. 106C TaxID=1932667 RepID=UPI000A370445|nr:response regulator [Nostoc sp. 106C]OUL31650.1 response regulator [Nostoc sp. 106C]